MSVPVGQRGETKLAVIDKAEKLCAYTINITSNEKRFPKRYQRRAGQKRLGNLKEEDASIPNQERNRLPRLEIRSQKQQKDNPQTEEREDIQDEKETPKNGDSRGSARDASPKLRFVNCLT